MLGVSWVCGDADKVLSWSTTLCNLTSSKCELKQAPVLRLGGQRQDLATLGKELSSGWSDQPAVLGLHQHSAQCTSQLAEG